MHFNDGNDELWRPSGIALAFGRLSPPTKSIDAVIYSLTCDSMCISQPKRLP
jgi:hypothetical protein